MYFRRAAPTSTLPAVLNSCPDTLSKNIPDTFDSPRRVASFLSTDASASWDVEEDDDDDPNARKKVTFELPYDPQASYMSLITLIIGNVFCRYTFSTKTTSFLAYLTPNIKNPRLLSPESCR